MYLNVNLTPPQTGGPDGSYTNTPKTPEILNSLISLTTTHVSAHTNYQSQAMAGDLLSPASSSTSPCDEFPTPQFGTHASGSQMSPTSALEHGRGGGRGALTNNVSRAFKGTPSPPVPELPSPVNTVEATKSALIKEGLKHQIKSKLQAAGLDSTELLTDTKLVKEEMSDSGDLTPQDEERRLRRRERNKIAATKCRNKKKEMTVILMSESETVEDQNLRLKSEIQRLSTEKKKLEKLLEDPSHVASCRRSCRGSNPPQPPLVVITSPDASERLRSSSSADGGALPQPGPDGGQGGSEQSGEILQCFPFPSSCVSPSSDSSYKKESPPSYTNVSPPAISSCSLPVLSPPQLAMSDKQFTTQAPYVTDGNQTTTYAGDTGVLSLSLPGKRPFPCPISTLPSHCQSLSAIPTSKPLISQSHASTPNSHYLAPKSSKTQLHKRHQPYAVNRQSKSSYPARLNHQQELPECGGYTPVTEEEETQISNAFLYPIAQSLNSSVTTAEIPICEISSLKSDYVAKMRPTMSTASSLYSHRYTPYTLSNRHTLTNTCPATSSSHTEPHCYPSPQTETYFQTSSCNPDSSFLSDGARTSFYPSCTYANLG